MAPNKPKNTAKNFRIDDDVWAEAKAIAAQRGEVISDEIRKFVHKYVEQNRELLEPLGPGEVRLFARKPGGLHDGLWFVGPESPIGRTITGNHVVEGGDA